MVISSKNAVRFYQKRLSAICSLTKATLTILATIILQMCRESLAALFCSYGQTGWEPTPLIVIAGLIVIPLVVSLLLLVIKNDTVRSIVVIAAVVLLAILAVTLTVQYLFAPTLFVVEHAELLGHIALAIDVVICAYIIFRAVFASKFLVVLLAGVQLVLVFVYDFAFASHAEVAADLYVDQLTLIMALIIAIIGGAICIYALGYMRDHQEHLDHEAANLAKQEASSDKAKPSLLTKDRRPVFFSIVFVFLSGMFLLVFSNRLSWFLTAWEVTTLCSFVLIGFTRTTEATANSFKAVAINLGGGLALCLALILAAYEGAVFELDTLIATAATGALVVPVMLISFAGMTKAAQLPFQGWLLGAMVAPTPVSALLHSSTMVKAGVFIIIKLAPAFGWNIPGLFVLIVGGLTFLLCSALAISQSNAKRVLAYSTVANLGLIICCAGVGTPEAVWAAIFLLIFHAAAKALLFCCVGTAEHHIGSRDIESMDNIFVRMPWLASGLALGMMAMFVAPFGMLISKWAALVSIAQSGHVELLIILAFGSALTFVFWTKWLGKVLAVSNNSNPISTKVTSREKTSLGFMALLLLCVTLGLPYLSDIFVVPYLQLQSSLVGVASWASVSEVISYDNLFIMNIVLIALLALIVVQILRKKPVSNDTVYMAGVGVDSEERSYRNALGGINYAEQRNWYLEPIFGEKAIGKPANVLATVVIALFFVIAIIAEVVVL